MLNDSQVRCLLIIHVSSWFIFTCFPSSIKGQAVQAFQHLFVPFKSLLGYLSGGGGNFDLIRKFLRFACLLYAIRGGWGKHSFKFWSCIVIDLQCFALICWIEGILGSYFNAKIGCFSLSFLLTFSNATFLGTFLALSIPLSIRLSGYLRAINSSFSSASLLSLSSGLVQILTILNPNE